MLPLPVPSSSSLHPSSLLRLPSPPRGGGGGGGGKHTSSHARVLKKWRFTFCVALRSPPSLPYFDFFLSVLRGRDVGSNPPPPPPPLVLLITQPPLFPSLLNSQEMILAATGGKEEGGRKQFSRWPSS